MENMGGFFFRRLGVVLHLLFLLANSQNVQSIEPQPSPPAAAVQLIRQPNYVVMSNGIVSITLTVPGGDVTNVSYKGSDNLLLAKDKETDRGHWDVSWSDDARRNMVDDLEGTSFKVVMESENQAEISFTRTWTSGSSNAPLNVDKRYIMLRGSPGFYTYAVLERLQEWPAFDIQEGRIVFKLQDKKFHYMAVSDERQRLMPTPENRGTGQPLDYPEAVFLTNTSNFPGEVDDKYFYSCDNKDNKVYGWVSTSDPTVGFWMITPSNEFRTGGPLKQDLTSHVGPTVLAMFISRHYAGEDLDLKFKTQEYWKKVLGPVYIYLNSDAAAQTDPSILWNDAKLKMQEEEASWPYNFPISKEFVKSNERGAVNGQLLVHDRLINTEALPAALAYVGLAPPGPTGSWQFENKGYQFWTQTDNNGNFLIKNVIPGNYSLFAWVPGTLGDYKHSSDIVITSGSNVTLENVVFEAPRSGPTLWEIGVPDRSAAEFFIPDPNPRFKIHPYKLKIEKFRQYGLWARYSDMYPEEDLIFTVGSSNYKTDWFYAHVTRKMENNQYEATTWQVVFDLKNVSRGANYTLQIALASANYADLQVRLNDPNSAPHFSTGSIGKDNAVARHGIRGLYRLYSISVEGSGLLVGNNTIFLTQANHLGAFQQVMYDYIRLEGPN